MELKDLIDDYHQTMKLLDEAGVPAVWANERLSLLGKVRIALTGSLGHERKVKPSRS